MMQQKSKERQAEYAELLKKPQWQKRRLQMLEAAGWKCVECGAEEQQLHVHHRRYIAGAKPWEYGDEDLAVLCATCHDNAHAIEHGSRPRAAGHRRPPSTANTLLRLVLQHPTWAARLPAALIPDDSPEGLALIAISDLLNLGEPVPAGGLGALIERFRDTPHGETLSRVAAELVDAEFDEAVAEALFKDTISVLWWAAGNAEIAEILQKRRTGVMPEDKDRLSDLLRARRRSLKAGLARSCRSEALLPPWEGE